jgi:hypothetical protein
MGKNKEVFTEMREKSLYAITEHQQLMMFEIEQMDGELTPEIEQQLEITKSELNQKSMAYLEVIGQKDGINTVIDIEVKRLQALKKRNNNIVTRLKDNLLIAVKTFGTYEVGLQKFGTRKSESIEVEFINELPEEFKTIKVTESANKIELKKALKDGIEINGVTLKTNYNLKIN